MLPRRGLLLAWVPATLLAAEDKWAAMGRAMEADFAKRYFQVDTPGVADYVLQVSQRIAPNRYRFTVMHGDVSPDPIAAPNGHIFVPVSLFRKATTEKEFVAWLARPMAMLERLESGLMDRMWFGTIHAQQTELTARAEQLAASALLSPDSKYGEVRSMVVASRPRKQPSLLSKDKK